VSEVERLSFSIDPALLRRLERLRKGSGYANRSEFIRDLVRDKLVEEEWAAGDEALGTITLLYDHHARGLSDRLTDLQHDAKADVLATTHLHLDHHTCAEMIMVRGKPADIRRLVDGMHQLKGVLHATLSMTSTGKRLA